ncbi:MAG: hypothetical protein A2293_10645 [Elusimicrobia bacterium RIFOXYB2_FULL_49_7]|nr:MAG: hypothetical protein A2293_10645 [Elusimicrobia bacterium RIFOXYB2_FULL_49_7]
MNRIEALVQEGKITRPTAEWLTRLNEQDAIPVLDLFSQIKMTVNQQRALLEWMDDIVKRDELSVAELFAEEEIVSLLQDPVLNGPQKRERIHERFHTRRFPEVSAFLVALKERLQALKVPSGIRITPIDPLEDRSFRLELTFHSGRELKERFQEAAQFLSGPGMVRFFEFLDA